MTPSDPLASNALAVALPAPTPASPGHTLVLPRRHVASYFDATAPEKAALWALVDEVKTILDDQLHPTGYHVSFDTADRASPAPLHLPHPLHIHIIPRLHMDAQPTARRPPLATGGDHDPFSQHLWPLFETAEKIAIVAAFVTENGLETLRKPVAAALRRGTSFRIVTGDYLAFNQVDALRLLLAWTQIHVTDDSEPIDDDAPSGKLQVRVVETTSPDGTERAFHPKSWLFEDPTCVAFVGSSNLSVSALGAGIEWNLRVERAIDPIAYAAVHAAVDQLWANARELTPAWIDAYAQRVRQTPRSLPPGDADAEPLEPPPSPHEFQREALLALANAREQGRRRALVVLATGLGKTWLAAFDVANVAKATGSWPRVLFLAHREELLLQAERTFHRLLVAERQPANVGWCAGDLMQTHAHVVVASVQKLSRPENLARVLAQKFDYVIIDEAHHADAPTYRRLLDGLHPAFLLGITATPDRADQGDILVLFDDFIAYRADLGVAIQRARLVPFAYHGVRDDIDYAQIPWRNHRFDPSALAAAAQTQQRMQRLWDAWREHPATCTLVFCCSIEHARFATQWLRERGVRVEAVFAGPGSADRSESLAQLARGELDALCVVDMFNEGVDIPAVDRVVMLRPTESPTVFLQQLGRGLRKHESKEKLTVIDFVGNHRIFLDRIRRLLSLTSSSVSIREYLASRELPELPPGCSIDLELEIKELLQTFLPAGALEVERVYRELFQSRGQRPTLGELYRMGYRPSTLRRDHGSWFRFVAKEGHLDANETNALQALAPWLEELETSAMPNALGLVVLEALLEADALATGLAIPELAQRSQALLQRSPELLRDVDHASELSSEEWVSFWGENPIAAWTQGRGWFAIEGDRFIPRRLVIPSGLEATVSDMTRELVDYRVYLYRARTATDAAGNAFTCNVTWNQRDPILKIPRGAGAPELPNGETDARLPDGSVWRFRFMAQFCNVARPVGTDRNRLPDLMREWFGPAAGKPGTRFQVQFSRSPDGWWIEPLGKTLTLPERGRLVSYPSLRAAAGVAADGRPGESIEAEEVSLPFDGRDSGDVFAVRAAGDSMDGGKTPIGDGDWLVMRWARGDALGSLAGRVALVETPDGHATFAYQVKRIVQEGGRWWLRSDNPDRAPIEATAETRPIARLVAQIAPEALAPAVGELIGADGVGVAFGLDPGSVVDRTGRYEGHLFVVVTDRGRFTEPDRIAVVVGDRRPGETAFVLARAEAAGSWRYCGVARWLDGEGKWGAPALDFATWRALGRGRDCSRRLPDAALDGAKRFLDELFARTGPGTWLERDGKRCRIVGRTAGGVRIDGGEAGFAERLVSNTDLAWVMVAAEAVAKDGGVLEEARVNRVRYLEGTPKGSTRWIDTGWGILILAGVVVMS